jgi:hypothetical protein
MLEPVRDALDERDSPVTLFFRDDDAGWRTDRLRALLDLFANGRKLEFGPSRPAARSSTTSRRALGAWSSCSATVWPRSSPRRGTAARPTRAAAWSIAEMDVGERARAARLLALLAEHPSVRARPMAALV